MQAGPPVGVGEAAGLGGGSGRGIGRGSLGEGAVTLDDLSQERPPVEIAGDCEQDVAGNEPTAVKTAESGAVDARQASGGPPAFIESPPSWRRQLKQLSAILPLRGGRSESAPLTGPSAECPHPFGRGIRRLEDGGLKVQSLPIGVSRKHGGNQAWSSPTPVSSAAPILLASPATVPSPPVGRE